MKLKHRIARYLGIILSCTLILAAAPASAELYQFTYTFTAASQPYGSGSQLTGFLEGTPDPANPDRILITDFGSVSLTIPGYLPFNFPSIEANEITTYLKNGAAPVATLNGSELSFSVCPSGFTTSQVQGEAVLNDCPFAAEGGFYIDTSLFDFIPFATTAIGGMETAPCYDVSRNGTNSEGEPTNDTWGCRVTELFTDMASAWQMTLVNVDPSVDIDPSVTLGDNTTLDKNITVEENVFVGDNVTVEKDVSIGADSEVGENSMLDKGTSTGSNVTIGENVTIEWNVVIQDGVSIGDGAYIYRGAVLCSGVSIGAGAVIGKNAVVDDDVPDTGAIPNDHPGSCTP